MSDVSRSQTSLLPSPGAIIWAWALPALAQVGESNHWSPFPHEPPSGPPCNQKRNPGRLFPCFLKTLSTCFGDLPCSPRIPHSVRIGPLYILLAGVWHHQDQTWSRGPSYFCGVTTAILAELRGFLPFLFTLIEPKKTILCNHLGGINFRITCKISDTPSPGYWKRYRIFFQEEN